jgi:urocanate hydratase
VTDANPRLPIHAAHGTSLTARSWQTEAPLRMLMNNLDPEVAENPAELVVYGGTGKAARSWEAYDALVRTLSTLADDETMLVQSGKPVGVFRTHEWAPRVLIANSNLVGDWANWEEFRRLEELGLTMYGQMTAGSWIYIGTQGILQGTFETFAAVADKRFAGTLAGTITLTAGLGGMGGAQPLAVTMNGGVAICIDVDQSRISRRIEHRYLDVQASSLEEALELAVSARDERRALSIGVLGNAAALVPQLLENDAPIDIVTDQTSAHDPLSYLPVGIAFEDWHQAAAADPVGFTKQARESMAAHVRAMVEFQDRGAEVFDYGNSIRDEARKGGYDRAFEFPASCRRTSGRCSARARAPSAGRRCPVTRRTSAGPTRRSCRCSPTTSGCARGSRWRRSGCTSRACRPGSAGSGTANATSPVCVSTRWSPPGSCRPRS